MTPEHRDVLIVGAGLSGIGAAWRLRRRRPRTTYAILEQRDRIGGTWDLFRYPGVRSDSDMFTLAYPFRAWRAPETIADGDAIRDYIEQTAVESGVAEHIRFGTTVVEASWSSTTQLWTLTTRMVVPGGDPDWDADSDEQADQTWTCRWLHLCVGYYDHRRGYDAEVPGAGEFAGHWVNPQFWPDDLDVTDQRVAVIGSGATAVTLVPALARTAASVTMIQRSPSYVAVLPRTDPVDVGVRARYPAALAHRWLRLRHAVLGQLFYQLARRRPERFAAGLREVAVRLVGDPEQIERHFTPSYRPWDQRLCVDTDGELFTAVRERRVEVVTDVIDRVVPTGIRLRSGREVAADVVVAATGFSLLALGGVTLRVDGRRIDVASTVAHRGTMMAGVPNLTFCVGYVNASWTLRADLVSRYLLRMLGYIDRHRWAVAMPESTPEPGRPLIDLTSGYVRRAAHLLPRQGRRDPWRLRHNLALDSLSLLCGPLRRKMIFSRRAR